MKGKAFDVQAIIQNIPIPDISSFSPKDGATLQSTNLKFFWAAVKSKNPLYYRFEINKLYGGRIYSTNNKKNMHFHAVPDGVLKTGNSYRWRIRVTDNDNWIKVNNRSQSKWFTFHISD